MLGAGAELQGWSINYYCSSAIAGLGEQMQAASPSQRQLTREARAERSRPTNLGLDLDAARSLGQL